MKTRKNEIIGNVTTFFRENKPILALLLLFFLIKIYFITSRYHLPIWDEAVYIGMGKYIYSAGAAGLWEMIRPYGLPMILGASWSIGLDQVYSSQIIAIFFSCATIFMTYLIAKELFNKKVALVSAFLLAITPVFFLYSIYALTEIPSTLFVLLAVYFYIKKKYIYSGLFTGIAFLFRFPQGLILVPIALAMVADWFFERKYPKNVKGKKNHSLSFKDNILIKNILFYAIGFAIIMIPFLSLNFIAYNDYTSKATDAIFRPLILAAPHQGNIFESVGGDTLSARLYDIFYYMIMMLKNNILFALSIFGAIMLLMRYKEKVRILSFAFLIYLAYYSYIINKQERFMIAFLPIICILTAYSLFYIIEKLLPKKTAAIKDYDTLNEIMWKSALVSLIIIALIITSITPIKTNVEYYYWLHPNGQKPAIIEEYYSLINRLEINGAILISEPVIAVFTNNRLIEYVYVDGKILISNEWESDDDIAAVTYTQNTVPCLEEDEGCKKTRDALLEYFTTNYETYYKGNFYDQDTYIFLKKQ